ncbi:MAG: glycosyltransferase [Bacteroidales bacterium]|nr:glycosyltransferase [Bacteroidales bacterium]
MSENPLVSVIVPIYKVENYLRECVNSIISQSYKNLEIILVDDGSPDKCPEICDEYALKDSRIRVIHKPNGGLSDARNAGIEIAKGEYLSFVDSDDVIHSQMIEVLMKPLIEDKGLKMSACQFLDFDDGKEFDKNQELKQVEIIDFREYFTKRIWTTAWGKVYEKSLFKNIKYPVGRLHEDEFTTYKICYEAKKVAYTDSQLLFYRQRENSIMAKMSLKRVTDIHDALKEQVDFFYGHNEIKVYAKFLVNFAYAYSFCKRACQDIEFISKWKSELKKYSIKPLTLKQKTNFILFLRFSKFRSFLSKCYKIVK